MRKNKINKLKAIQKQNYKNMLQKSTDWELETIIKLGLEEKRLRSMMA